MRCEKGANNMQNRAQMKKSKCAIDILKCANEKRPLFGFSLTVKVSPRECVLDIFQLQRTLGFVRCNTHKTYVIQEGLSQQCYSETFNNFISRNLRLG